MQVDHLSNLIRLSILATGQMTLGALGNMAYDLLKSLFGVE